MESPHVIDESVAEAQSIAENIDEWSKRLRTLEQNCRSYNDSANVQIARLVQLVQGQRSDQDHLQHELSLLIRPEDATLADAALAQATLITGQLGVLDRRTADEQTRVNQLRQQCLSLKLEMQKHNKETRAGGTMRDSMTKIAKQIVLATARRDKTMARLHETMTQNQVLRSELDVLRRDRINSESVYRQVEIQLTDSKQQTSAMIDKLNHVHETLEVASDQTAELKERFNVELLQQQIFEAERNTERDTAMIECFEEMLLHPERIGQDDTAVDLFGTSVDLLPLLESLSPEQVLELSECSSIENIASILLPPALLDSAVAELETTTSRLELSSQAYGNRIALSSSKVARMTTAIQALGPLLEQATVALLEHEARKLAK